MKIDLKRIALITMCAMLALTVILSAVVIGKASPLIQMLAGGGPTQPTVPASEQTAPSGTETEPTATDPSQPTSPLPTVQPTAPAGHTHTFRLKETVEATCDQAGYSTYVCTCGASEIRDYVEPKGHSFGAGKLISPTCTEEGRMEFTCLICGYVDVRDPVDALGHDYQAVKVHEGNCTEDGYTEYQCTRCGNIKREDVKPAPGHTFSDWSITREPSDGDPGERTRECTTCHETEKTTCELEVRPMKTDAGAYNDYIVTLWAKNSHGESVEVFTYYVQDYGKRPDMHYAYEEKSGMTVSFTDAAGSSRVYPLQPGGKLIIGEDGSLKSDATEPSQPSDPTEPTQAEGSHEEPTVPNP